jgi:hypothetical protein
VTVTTVSLQKQTHKVCLLTLVFLILCLSILNHPYAGIVDDSMLYTAEALNKLNSKTYASDFYFLNTYQSRFSVTTYIYAKCIAAFGLVSANIILFVVGQSLWLAGACLTTGVFFRGFSRFAAMAVVISFPSCYGESDVFSFFEPFYSPRLFSEAFVLFAVFFWARSRWVACLSCIAAACVLHPLMAIPGVVVLASLALRSRKEILWAFIPVVLGVIGMAFLGVEPFSNLLAVMDGDWLEAVRSRCSFLFISKWPTHDLVWMSALFALASMAYVYASGKQREILGAVIVAALLLNGASFIFGDLLHNVLVVQLQLWRSSWLLLFFVGATFYSTVSKYCVMGPVGLVVGALLCVYVYDVAVWPYSYIALSVAVVLAVVIRLSPFLKIHWVFRSVRNRIFVYVFVLLSILLVMKASGYYSPFPVPSAIAYNWKALSKALPMLTAAALWWGHMVCRIPGRRRALLAAAVVAACLCAATWDRRGQMQRQMFAEDEQAHRIRRIIPEGSLVFWPGACSFSWFYLQRGNYLSSLQSAGVLFSRVQGEQYIEKIWLLALDRLSGVRSGFAGVPPEPGKALFSGPKVEYICKQYQDLDFILIPEYLPELEPVTSLSFKLRYVDHLQYFLTEQPIVDPTIYVYDCNALRHMATSSPSAQ